MRKKIDLTDPSSWQEINWDSEPVPEVLKRDDSYINRARANRLKAQDPNWLEANRQSVKRTSQRPDVIEKNCANLIKGRAQIATEKGRSNHLAALEKRNQDPKYHDSIRQRTESIDWQEANRQSVRNRTENNIEWQKKNCRPCRCPFGTFLRRIDAIKAYVVDTGYAMETAKKKVKKMLDDPGNLEWQYITWEEWQAQS